MVEISHLPPQHRSSPSRHPFLSVRALITVSSVHLYVDLFIINLPLECQLLEGREHIFFSPLYPQHSEQGLSGRQDKLREHMTTERTNK